MNYFTEENTEGFSKEELDKMNVELENRLSSYNEDDLHYSDMEQNIADDICRKRC
jgi:hypothetical protein